jgi:hypothetical protein
MPTDFIHERKETSMSGAGTLDEPDRVPLTSGQRARLLTDCMIFVVFVVIVVGFQVFWVPLAGAPNPLFYLFIVIALAVTGYDAYRRLRISDRASHSCAKTSLCARGDRDGRGAAPSGADSSGSAECGLPPPRSGARRMAPATG